MIFWVGGCRGSGFACFQGFTWFDRVDGFFGFPLVCYQGLMILLAGMELLWLASLAAFARCDVWDGSDW